MGKVTAVSISKKKGIPKSRVDEALLIENSGILGDAHAGNWHRQVSLLAIESINKMRSELPKIRPGAFAENITTEDIDLLSLKPGNRLKIGNDSLIEITQIGKECHTKCAIYFKSGYCVMPTDGIFAKVLKGGKIKPDDEISILS